MAKVICAGLGPGDPDLISVRSDRVIRAAAQVGRRLRVLADTPHIARAEADAPDIDGRVLLERPLAPGKFHDVLVTGTQVYDLIAKAV